MNNEKVKQYYDMLKELSFKTEFTIAFLFYKILDDNFNKLSNKAIREAFNLYNEFDCIFEKEFYTLFKTIDNNKCKR